MPEHFSEIRCKCEVLNILDNNKVSIVKSINKDLKRYGLEIVGTFNPQISTHNLVRVKTLLLVGPKEPNFWRIFKESEEYKDTKPNPLDRWSRRVLTGIADEKKTEVYFPFEKEHVWPFYSWALECDSINVSPVKLLVHNKRGLFLSFRGALGITQLEQFNEEENSVCDSCRKPCLTACPVGALSPEGYNVTKCKEYISTNNKKSCYNGCLVRKSCPYGSKSRPDEQSSFHMKSFLKL